MAAHRGHWTAGLRGLWCLGGKGLGAPGGTEGKGAWLRWIYYPPLAAITNEIQCAITYVRRDIPAKVLSVFASYHASLFHPVHTYPRILSSSSSSNRSTRLFFFFSGLEERYELSNLLLCAFFREEILLCLEIFDWNMRLEIWKILLVGRYLVTFLFEIQAQTRASLFSDIVSSKWTIMSGNRILKSIDFHVSFVRVSRQRFRVDRFWCCLTFHTLLQFFQENLSSKRKFWKSYSISKYSRMFLALLSSFCFRTTWNTTSIYHFVLITLSCRDLVSLRKFSTARFRSEKKYQKSELVPRVVHGGGGGGWSFNARLFSRYDSFPVRRFFDCMEIL